MWDGRLEAERLWMVAAGLCMVVAAVALLWRWHVETAFVAATLGLVCWFLNLRTRLKKSISTSDEDVDEEEDYGEKDEDE